MEMDERLRAQARGHWRAAELLRAASVDGHGSLGFGDAGRIAVGAARRPRHARPHQPAHRRRRARPPETAVFAATAADVATSSPAGGSSSTATTRRVGRELDARDRRGLGRPVSARSVVVTGIGELVTHDPQHGGPARARRPTPPSSSSAAGSPGPGPPGWRPPADERRRRGRPRGDPGLRRLPQPPGLRRRPGRRSSRPGWPGGATTAAASGPPSPRPGPPPTSSSRRTCCATSARCAAGHHDGRGEERLRAHGPRRGAGAGARLAGSRPETTFLGAHVVPAGVRRRPGRLRRPRDRADARGLRAARPVDRRLLRARCLRRRPGPRGARRPARPPGCRAGCTPTSSAPGPGCSWPASSGWPRSTTAPTSSDADVAALRDTGDGRDAAARGGVLHPLALPRRPGAARRRRRGRAGHRLQPGLLLHLARCRSAWRWRSGRWG